MAIVLNRRALLEAAGMAVLAMPALELTAPRRARAGGAGAIKRFVLMYCGLSTGRDGEGQLIVPNATGAGYDLPRSLNAEDIAAALLQRGRLLAIRR